VANYNVDIEVGVKGAARLDKFTATVNQLAEKLDLIDKNFGQGIQNVARYERNIAKATDALRKARMGTQDETDAVKAYVRALGEANAARARQIALIAREQAASRTINPGATGFSRAQYGPAMPPAMVRQQQAIQGLSGTLNELTQISKQISVSNTNLRTSWGKAFEGLNETAKFFSVSRLNTQTSWLKTFEQLNETARAISVSRTNTQTSWLKTFEQLNDTAKAISVSRTNTQTSWLKTLEGLKETANAIKVSKNNVGSSWLQALDELESTATDIRRANRNRQRRARVERGRASQERMQSAVGSGVIGGAFPLLFGQGLAPAVGGGLGGFAGGLLGGQFGFGLGLVGTQLGAIFQQAQDVAAALGKAFRTGEQAAQALEDAVGSLNKETENYINNLEQSGQLGRQQEAILEVLEEKFGSQARAYLESAKSADRFKESTDGLFKSLQRLFIPATVEFNAITDGPLVEEPTPDLTKAAERRLSLLKGELKLEHLITAEKSLQGTKDFERLASIKKLVAQAKFQIDLEKLQNDQQTGRISADEYDIKLKIRQTQLGRELTEIERQRADAVKKSAEEMERLVDEMVRGVNQAAAPGAGMAKALKEENQFLQNAVKFGVEAAEDIRQINRLTFSGAMSAQEAMDLVEQNRQFKEILKSRNELNKVTGTRGDPTINLQKRLNILNKQIASEQKFADVSFEGASIIKRKLDLESRIAKIQETGAAERKLLTDQEDIRLSQAVETQAIKLENLKFEREATALIERQNKAGKKLLEPLQRKLDAIRDRNAFEKEYGELIMKGSTPAAAKQVIEAQKQKKEIDRLVEKQLESNEILIENLRIKVAETEGTKAHAAAVDALNAALRRRNEIEEKGRIAKGEIDEEKTPAERIEEEKKRIQETLNELMDPVDQLISLADTLGDAFSESFKGLVTGSMSAQEALANLFQRTADHFLDMAAKMIAAQIKMQILNIGLSFFDPSGAGGGGAPSAPAGKSGTIPSLAPSLGGSGGPFNDSKQLFAAPTLIAGKALGGAVGAGKPYLVGEKGPELFVPGAMGNIVPNKAMGGTSIVVNVSASEVSSESDEQEGKQLGQAIGIAVRSEILKQQRPGGLLA
jgi:hypothetical protein|tara:strand:+ start:495 stop:3800 length:3306 start_codon:yes stop_codon:yes gene_type:complete